MLKMDNGHTDILVLIIELHHFLQGIQTAKGIIPETCLN